MDKLIKSGSGVKGILIIASGLILGLIESNLENATVLQLVSPPLPDLPILVHIETY